MQSRIAASLIVGTMLLPGTAALSPAFAAPSSPAPATVAERATVTLDGAQWEIAATTAPTSAETPPADGWQAVTVPSTLFQTIAAAPQYRWYRRDITIPADWAGRRLFIDVRGARNAPQVFLDGKRVGGQLDGWTPLRVEITNQVKPGTKATLVIRCQDRTATFSPERLAAGKPYDNGDRGSTIAPVGGYHDLMGIWDSVRLESTPATAIDARELVIVPSTRQKTLTVRGHVAAGNVSPLRVGVRVLEADGKTVAVNAPPVSVGANGDWQSSIPFPKAHYWSPEDPYRYTLEVSLSEGAAGGKLRDRYSQRFGFKEIWTDGPDFYINGVKRHLLAAATWPVGSPVAVSDIRARVKAIRESNANCFRLHTGPWPEAWLDAADEFGLLIVDEGAVYTDGDGFYAYTDPRFWKNYQDHIAGMIRRDRNHPSLALWSLENETLFMNNQRFDPKLPQKFGDTARFARALDPTHPITFEADRDPDGAADVIGLHYPHEPPAHVDYPNTADWLQASSTIAEAAGGMLGKASGEFSWDRKKPLYIGEYLWDPQGDFSTASIFFGDRAYENRDNYHHWAQLQSFYDQTIAYRRAGVSGLSPWATFGFGAVDDSPGAVAIQKIFYRPVTALLRDRGLRSFAGEKRTLTYDVFNDSPTTAALTVELRSIDTGATVAAQKLSLAPGGYQAVPLALTVPAATTDTALKLETVLRRDGAILDRTPFSVPISPRKPLHVASGQTLVVYDPAHRWPGSVASLAGLTPGRTLLLIAADALGRPQQRVGNELLPLVGSSTDFDTAAFHSFLERGGRALVLEQSTLAPLGLVLELTQSPATMTFALQPHSPLFQGLTGADLSFWRGDNYVTRQQVRRPTSGGAQALVVTGGANGLDLAPVLDIPVGDSGRVLLIQADVDTKRNGEPAAQRLLQNAVDLLASPTAKAAPRGSTLVIGSADSAVAARLKALGLDVRTVAEPREPDLKDVQVLVLNGSLPSGLDHETLDAFLKRGGTIYGLNPDVAGWGAIAAALGGPAAGIEPVPSVRGASLLDRDDPLLAGISREDVTYVYLKNGWDHPMDYDPTATNSVFLPHGALPLPEAATRFETADAPIVGGKPNTIDGVRCADFDRKGTVALTIPTLRAGLYAVTLPASAIVEGNDPTPILLVDVNGVVQTYVAVTGRAAWEKLPLVLHLEKGKNAVTLRFVNGASYGGTPYLRLGALAVGAPLAYPAGMKVLTLPGSLVSWPVGAGRVVLDSSAWLTNKENATRADRYANALFGNLGARFTAPSVAKSAGGTPIPLTQFQLVGESAYSDFSADTITLRNNGTVAARFVCGQSGTYRLRVQAHSTPYQGVYAHIKATLDGAPIGEGDDPYPTTGTVDLGTFSMKEGVHRLEVSFTNDASGNGEDRNLFITGVSLQKEP